MKIENINKAKNLIQDREAVLQHLNELDSREAMQYIRTDPHFPLVKSLSEADEKRLKEEMKRFFTDLLLEKNKEIEKL